ncbi:MAG: two-component regulator propeller domain-containing protein [Pyrinomonadaceae bacterium]
MFKCLRKACSILPFPLHFFLCLLVILLLFNLVTAERLPVKTYTVADGLPRDSVRKIKQDSRGFLWFCTLDGISRFDGEAFTNFTTGDGLPERHVNDFLESKTGTIWVATDGGLARLNPSGIPNSQDNPLFTVILPEDPRASSIQVLFEDEGGSIWMGTNHGLYQLSGNSLRPFDLGITDRGLDTQAVGSIMKDHRGTIWIGIGNGICRVMADGRVERFTPENGLPESSVSKLYEDKKGRVWAGFRAGGSAALVMLAAEPLKNQNIVEALYREKDGLPADWVTDLLETSDGKFWVGTTRGLCEWQGGDSSVRKTYRTKNDLCDGEIWSLAEDTDANLWLGSQCGAKKWSRYGFTSYHEIHGMDGQLANSIFTRKSG